MFFKTFNVFQSYLITVCKEPVKAILTGETFAIETHGVCGKFSGQGRVYKVYCKNDLGISKSLFSWEKTFKLLL